MHVARMKIFFAEETSTWKTKKEITCARLEVEIQVAVVWTVTPCTVVGYKYSDLEDER
jgi:hypothetical protein